MTTSNGLIVTQWPWEPRPLMSAAAADARLQDMTRRLVRPGATMIAVANEPRQPSVGPIFVITRQLDVLARFYAEVIGLQATRRDPDHHVWHELSGPDFVLHVPQPEPGVNFTPAESGILVWFEVTEARLAEAAAAARRFGATTWGPYDGGARTLLYAIDPDGNAIGLYAPRTASQ